MQRPIICAFALLGLVFTAAALADWPNWRGPLHNGSAPEAANLPDDITDANIAWAADMPGPAAATPVVVGDRLFLSAVGEDNQLLVMAFDAATGEQLWHDRVGQADAQNRRSTMANPSPAADDRHVVFLFSNGQMAGYTHAGDQLWQRSITDESGEFAFLFSFAASPILHDGKIYQPVLQRDNPVRGKGKPDAESYLLIIDPATGETLEHVTRPTDARGESMEAYTTVIPATIDDRPALLLTGGDALTIHQPGTGRELWRWTTYNPKNRGNFRTVASPVQAGGRVIVPAPQGDPVYAIQPGSDQPVWVADDNDIASDVATPLVYQGNLYILNGDKQVLIRLDPATGQVQWKTPVRGNKLRASPTGADGKIYLLNHDAELFIVDADSGELLSTTKLDDSDQARSTVIVADDRLYIRTDRKLYCVGR